MVEDHLLGEEDYLLGAVKDYLLGAEDYLLGAVEDYLLGAEDYLLEAVKDYLLGAVEDYLLAVSRVPLEHHHPLLEGHLQAPLQLRCLRKSHLMAHLLRRRQPLCKVRRWIPM